MSDEVFDVLIVGFGPCGQVLAAQLGGRGHSVFVAERSPDPYPLPRAGHVDDEIVRVFQGIGAADEFEDRAVTPRGYEWLSADRETLFVIDWNKPTSSTWRSDYIFYQPYLEEALTRAALAQPTITVVTGWEAVAIVDEGDVFTVELREGARTNGDRWQPTGRTRTVQAKYVIGADGAKSFVRGAMGVRYEDLAFEETLSIVDLRLDDPDMDIDMPDAGQICDPVRPISLFRWLGREHCRWEFMLLPGEDPEELVSEAGSWAKLAQWGVTPENATMIRRTLYTFNSLICEDFRSNRLFLVGDAAHLMPPFLGQGMCTGLRDVTNLAWKLDLVLRGTAGPDLLDTYTTERRPHVREVTATAIELGKVLCELDPEIAQHRDDALRSGMVPPTPPLPGLAHGVLQRTPDGDIDFAHGAGILGIQGHVTLDGRTGRFDDVVGRGWVVLSRKHGLEHRLSDPALATLEALDATVVHVTKAAMPIEAHSVMDRDGGYAAWFRRLDADVIIVRPDFYTYGSAAEEDAATLIEGLADALSLATQPV
ncbi:bifunctional 3-(3-hydroxy-phenyl)propionate/3-hydroxycinnamic acid hydroxylase [Leifsonia sp. NPDC058194]|uniref:bifunctional 3-(3-hydroxy-phenyl)propionate/3-hydroxycinnamic acid hydroxylase MhpA n=1 Tax=Leifsonia sp. NPDC058194 TaxID=3346374 RepID=UPI0036D85759